MRNQTIYIIIILTVVLFFLLLVLRPHSPFGSSNSGFSVKPRKEITRIELSGSGQKLVLEKSYDTWTINGKPEARKGGISFMLRILTEARIKSPVSDELFRSEIIEKGITPVVVKVYEGKKLLHSFRVYKTSSNIYGNIMKVRERSKPFIVHVPGYEVSIGSVFTLSELYWKPYTIFNLLPSEISSVKFENKVDPINSFSVVKKDGKYALSDNGGERAGADQSLIIRYLSYFTFIPFEKWAIEMSEEEKEDLRSREPVYRITVITAEGIKNIISMWQINTKADGMESIDTDRLIGSFSNSNDYFYVRYFDIDPVLKDVSYFFPESGNDP